jgi:hypothetical protein
MTQGFISSGAITFIASSMILCGIVPMVCIEQSFALESSEWRLMARHGECAEITTLERKVPDLGEIRDPSTFAKLMREKGYRVTVNEVSTPIGKAVEVNVLERELSLIFVTPEVCQAGSK